MTTNIGCMIVYLTMSVSDIVRYTYMPPIFLVGVNPTLFDKLEDVFHESFMLLYNDMSQNV